MDAPLIAPSAREHGHSDSDMIHAFNHPIFVDELDGGFTMFVGADPAANLLEIGVVDTSDGPIIVHAMPARPKPEVTTMPRTAQEILDHADELAARFEAHEPGDGVHDATELRLVREAFLARADAERVLGDAVVRARHNGHSWASIGAMVGTSGEAARQRYGQSVNAS